MLAGGLIAACDGTPEGPTATGTQANTPTGAITVTVSPSPVPPTATPTPEPPVARVNGREITLAEYNAEFERLELALAETGTELATDVMRERVLQDLIDQHLLAQAAEEAGFIVEPMMVDERIEALAAQVGGITQLEAWQQTYAYTPESFRQDLARAIAAAWMRDNIITTVPEAVEQVYARQILLYNSEDAAELMRQLNTGGDFEVLARVNDPQGFGELGWFPQGYLTVPEIEAAAFALQPDEISDVIESPLGFHIIKVVDRADSRPLEPQARYELQLLALQNWLIERRASSEIEVLLT